jgi:hypothetical protein
MPYCTHCRQDYPDNYEQCPECGHLLLPEKPEWRPYDPEKPFILIRTVYSELQAYLIKGQLEQEGIPVLLQPREAGATLGLVIDGWGEHRLSVPESLVDEAKEILAVYEEEE